MPWKTLIHFIALSTLLASCRKTEILLPTDQVVDQTFENGLIINGHEFDSLLIEGCTFLNKPLDIANCDYVVIRNCSFRNTKGNGIQIARKGPCNNLIIDGCSFKDIGFMGVDIAENSSNCIIQNSTFENVARSQIGAAMGEPHHNIYNRGLNLLIENNYFQAEKQKKGNVISTRSSGIIRNNIILNGPMNGINYFADHPGGDSLLIENNFIYNSFYSGILLAGKEGKSEWHNNHIIIRFNTIAVSGSSSIYVDRKFENTTNIPIYGNIMVNADATYIETFYPLPHVFTNLQSATDVGFVQLSTGNLHLTADSQAIGFASSITEFPNTDIDGDFRNQSTLNAGADEFQ